MEQELPLRIILVKPPAGVDFALQKGHGNTYETVEKQRSNGGDLIFEFSVRVKASQGQPNFLGPFTQGTPKDRFVYIDIGAYAGQTGTAWSRRLKIPLTSITAKMIKDVVAVSKSRLETRVPGTGKDGGPACASVKPFPGWNQVMK